MEESQEYIGSERMLEALSMANDIMKTGVKASDAAHIACAALAGCDYFITTDKRILKHQTSGIQIVNPVQFVRIWETIQ
jgi:predicted nucleic acid-binding protein